MMGYYDYWPMMGYEYGWFGWISMIIFWLFVVVIVVAIARRYEHGSHPQRHEHSALEILKERYAKGEIDRKEFEEKKKDIEH